MTYITLLTIMEIQPDLRLNVSFKQFNSSYTHSLFIFINNNIISRCASIIHPVTIYPIVWLFNISLILLLMSYIMLNVHESS